MDRRTEPCHVVIMIRIIVIIIRILVIMIVLLELLYRTSLSVCQALRILFTWNFSQ